MSKILHSGTHRARITGQGYEAALTGNTLFYLLFVLLFRIDENGQQHPCQGNGRYQQTLANPAGFGILKADIKALGVDLADLAQLHPDNPDGIKLVGKEIDVVCEVDSYNGYEFPRWTIQRRKKQPLDAILALQKQFGHLLIGKPDGGSDAAA